jgi:tetratricopeptide (TPR) repeat protein
MVSMKKAILGGVIIGGILGGLLVVSLKRAEIEASLEAFRARYDEGDLDGVIAQARGALERNTEDVDALLAAATAYAMKGSVGFSERSNGQKAIEYADRALKLAPENAEALRIKAYALEIQERYDEAHQYYDRAIASNPNHYQALSNKGHAHDLQGDLVEAEKWYQRSLAVNPKGEHALLNISRLYLRQRKYTEAKESLLALIASSTNLRFQAEGYQNLAEVYRGEMNYSEAKKAIERSLELDPAVPQAWVTRGRIRMVSFLDDEEGEKTLVSDVTDYANKALEIHPQQASAYALLFDLTSATGDVAQRDTYRAKALDAIDKDISLGQREREALRNYLGAEITATEDPLGQTSSAVALPQ